MAEWVQVPTGEKSGMWALERKEREWKKEQHHTPTPAQLHRI